MWISSVVLLLFKCVWIHLDSTSASNRDTIVIDTINSGNQDAFLNGQVYEHHTKLSDYGIVVSTNITLQFKVKACNNAFVLLSPAHDLVSREFYEIGIGGTRIKTLTNNVKNTIRKGQGVAESTTYRVDTLSCDEFRSFWISWKMPEVKFGAGTSVLKDIIIDWYDDSQALNIQALGIMTGWGSSGQWKFEIPACANGTYGYHCDKTCGHCKFGNCDRVIGSCHRGCVSGWKNYRCDEACEPGTYGEDCKSTCKCYRTHCDRVTGVCPFGKCELGWTGKQCSEGLTMCPCTCAYRRKLEYWLNQTSINYTKEELLEVLGSKLEDIRHTLTIDKHLLSSYRRMKMSIPDFRKSSKQIGIVGSLIVMVVVGLVILIDLIELRRHVETIRRIWGEI